MAVYPVKMIKDENGQPFVPITGANAIVYDDAETLQQKLDKKLEKDNIIAGANITLSKSGNNITISSGATGVLIDNLTTTTAGKGALDARQGSVLKNLIDTIPRTPIIDDVTSTSTTSALSANQGYLLNNKFNNYLLKTDLSAGILSADIRSTVTTPQTYDKSLRTYFMSNSTDGLNDGGSYHGVLYYRPYGTAVDWSGGPAHEIGFTQMVIYILELDLVLHEEHENN